MRHIVLLVYVMCGLITIVSGLELVHMQQFLKNYTVTDSSVAHSLVKTSDGGFLMSGWVYKKKPDRTFVCVLKLDSNGVVSWTKVLYESKSVVSHKKSNDDIGERNPSDWANAALEAHDGYLIAGKREYPGADHSDAWIIKLDAQGTVIWEVTYGDNKDEEAVALVALPDGDFLVAGITVERTTSYSAQYCTWLHRYSSTGVRLWEKKVSDFSTIQNVITLSNGNVLIVGGKKSGNSTDGWLVEAETNGKIIHEKTISKERSVDFTAIRNLNDGGFIAIGTIGSIGTGSCDAWLVKLDKDYTLVWENTLGDDHDDIAKDVVINGHNGFIITGQTRSSGAGYYDAWIVNVDERGEILKEMIFGDVGEDRALGIFRLHDGQFVVLGSSENPHTGNKHPWLLKLDEESNPVKTW